MADQKFTTRIVPPDIPFGGHIAEVGVAIYAAIPARIVRANVNTFITSTGITLIPVFFYTEAVSADFLYQCFIDAMCLPYAVRLQERSFTAGFYSDAEISSNG